MHKVVFDSTTLVSAFLRKTGLTGVLLKRAAEGECELYLADAIIDETEHVLLNREHLRLHFLYTNIDVEEYVTLLRTFAHIVSNLPDITVCRDPNDDYILATAVAAGASYLVARDKDLLSMVKYEEVAILTPEAFLQLLRTPSTTA